MFGLVTIVPASPPAPIDRSWLIFFRNPDRSPWWARFLRPGFRHVSAAAFYAREGVWVEFDPTRRGTAIRLYSQEEFGGRLEHLISTSAAVLRVRSELDRRAVPMGCFCVGQIKALLGIRSRALLPATLCRHLLARGAEIVEVPGDLHGRAVRPARLPAGKRRDAATA